jgi:menaquinone-dependent protoporphyrinogen oxidase
MDVLIAVASRHGSTREIGEAVAAVLRDNGHRTVVRAPEDVANADDADAVILGSAVYLGHWLPAARDLGERLVGTTHGKPVWLFSSGLATQPAQSANSPHEIAALVEALDARGHRSFRGRLDLELLSFAERSHIAAGRARAGDHRDFDAVARWATDIAAEVTPIAV